MFLVAPKAENLRIATPQVPFGLFYHADLTNIEELATLKHLQSLGLCGKVLTVSDAKNCALKQVQPSINSMRDWMMRA